MAPCECGETTSQDKPKADLTFHCWQAEERPLCNCVRTKSSSLKIAPVLAAGIAELQSESDAVDQHATLHDPRVAWEAVDVVGAGLCRSAAWCHISARC